MAGLASVPKASSVAPSYPAAAVLSKPPVVRTSGVSLAMVSTRVSGVMFALVAVLLVIFIAARSASAPPTPPLQAESRLSALTSSPQFNSLDFSLGFDASSALVPASELDSLQSRANRLGYDLSCPRSSPIRPEISCAAVHDGYRLTVSPSRASYAFLTPLPPPSSELRVSLSWVGHSPL